MRLFVPSINRPERVAPLARLAGDIELVWLVPEWQAEAYRAYGATSVITGHPRKANKVNETLDRFADEWCVFTDDDCKGMIRLSHDGRFVRVPLAIAAAEFVRIGTLRRDYLVNIAHMTNHLFMTHSVSTWGPIAGWFFAVAPGAEVRYDTELGEGEDVDFGARFVERYGRLCRPNWYQGLYPMGGPRSGYDHSRDVAKSAEIVRRYPHLFAGWGPPNRPGTSGVLRYRQLPKLPRSVR